MGNVSVVVSAAVITQKLVDIAERMPQYAREYDVLKYGFTECLDDDWSMWVHLSLPRKGGKFSLQWGYEEAEEPVAEGDTLLECIQNAHKAIDALHARWKEIDETEQDSVD